MPKNTYRASFENQQGGVKLDMKELFIARQRTGVWR
jgi:hypothetical protein